MVLNKDEIIALDTISFFVEESTKLQINLKLQYSMTKTLTLDLV